MQPSSRLDAASSDRAIPLPCGLERDVADALPSSGRHVCASYDDTSIVVYQAYRPAIVAHAVATGSLAGAPGFSLGRMSWVKPNFLWMMYRSGWGTKPDQEATIGLRLSRAFFEELLARAVASSFDARRFATHEAWKAALARSDVRLQWDPDHGPRGEALERRAIQLGLRGETLRRLATTELLEVIDLTPFVEEQRRRLGAEPHRLVVPAERLYRPADRAAAENVGLNE